MPIWSFHYSGWRSKAERRRKFIAKARARGITSRNGLERYLSAHGC